MGSRITELLRKIRRHAQRQPGLWMLGMVLVGLQVAVALGSSRFFFNSDTIYYLARRVHGLADVWGTLIQYDDRGNFRPFTFWISSGLLVPLGGLNNWAYHLFTALIHSFNTWLCFCLTRRLTGNRATAMMAAFFFGLHWVFFNITYGLVCLPDLSYVLFTLLALLAFQRYLEARAATWKILSFGACLGAFLSKEMAVIVPLLLLALCWLRGGQEALGPPWYRRLAEALNHTAGYWVLLVFYLLYFALLGGGSILPSSPEHPYAAELSPRQLVNKGKYLWWLSNLPPLYDRSRGPSAVMHLQAEDLFPTRSVEVAQQLFLAEGLSQGVAVAFWLPVIVVGVIQTCRHARIRRFLPLCLALGLSLTPVLFLIQKMMPHNVYLASVGFALWLAVSLESWRSSSWWRNFPWLGMREWALFAYLVASLVGIYTEVHRSWLVHGSVMAETAMEDLRRTLPDLAPNAGLYFQKSSDGGLPWYYDGGNLFRVLLNKPRLWVRFEDRQDDLPTWVSRGANNYILRVIGTHIYNVTDEYLLPSDRIAEDLLPLFDLSAVSVNRAEYYPSYERFNTPNGQAAFISAVHRFHVGRKALVLLGGGSVTGLLPPTNHPSELLVRACLVNNFGDGVMGRLTANDGQGVRTLLEKEFLPVEKGEQGGWLETRIDLPDYTGRSFQVKLEAFNRWGHNTVADWLAWSLVRTPKETR